MSFTLKSLEFRREREAAWVELESLIEQVSKRGMRSLSADEAARLPMLYRSALSALSVARDEVHPTRNLENPDRRCDLDYVPNESRRMPVPAAISNSFGFGGQNATLVVGKAA